MEVRERVKLVKEATLIMKDLLVSHNERMDVYHDRIDDFDEKFRQSREDFDFKMNALIDSQIRNAAEFELLKVSTSKLEVSTKKLSESTRELRETSRDLKDASRRQLKRIENLETV